MTIFQEEHELKLALIIDNIIQIIFTDFLPNIAIFCPIIKNYSPKWKRIVVLVLSHINSK